jgi:hypothetical protein
MSSTEIHDSVGEKGTNRPLDVTLVQRLLNSKGFNAGRVDGIFGSSTGAAIRKFQATFLAKPDGLIEPRHISWVRLVSAFGTPATPHLLQWSGDSARWSQDKKLMSMHPDPRPRVVATLAALAKQNFQPQVFFGWRSVAAQREIVKQGHSSVSFSFHNAQKKDGTPNAYAADIVDARYLWNPQAAASGFWNVLGAEAKKQQLFWGGDWQHPDVAHVQLVPNSELKRIKHESGL